MTPEQQLRALRRIAEKHPRTGIQSALERIKADITVNRLRDEIGYQRRAVTEIERVPPTAGATEGLT